MSEPFDDFVLRIAGPGSRKRRLGDRGAVPPTQVIKTGWVSHSRFWATLVANDEKIAEIYRGGEKGDACRWMVIVNHRLTQWPTKSTARAMAEAQVKARAEAMLAALGHRGYVEHAPKEMT